MGCSLASPSLDEVWARRPHVHLHDTWAPPLSMARTCRIVVLIELCLNTRSSFSLSDTTLGASGDSLSTVAPYSRELAEVEHKVERGG